MDLIRGTTPGATPAPTQGPAEQTTTSQQQHSKPTATTTTTTDFANAETLVLWEPLELSAPAEDYRDLLVEICKAHNLPHTIAREIGWEMSQRLIDSAHDPKSPIYSIRDWLKSVAETAASGKNILSRGYKFRNTLRRNETQAPNVADAIQNKFIENSSERQKVQLAVLEKFIRSASPAEIQQVIEQVKSNPKDCRYAEKIAAALQSKTTPTGPTRIALFKAIRELNFIED